MFQLFIGKPSTSEGLSLSSSISSSSFCHSKVICRLHVHVALLRDELHGTLDLGTVSYNSQGRIWNGQASKACRMGILTSATILTFLSGF